MAPARLLMIAVCNSGKTWLARSRSEEALEQTLHEKPARAFGPPGHALLSVVSRLPCPSQIRLEPWDTAGLHMYSETQATRHSEVEHGF